MQHVHILDQLAAVRAVAAFRQVLTVVGRVGEQHAVLTGEFLHRLGDVGKDLRLDGHGIESLLGFRAVGMRRIVVFKCMNTDHIVFIACNELQRLCLYFRSVFRLKVVQLTPRKDVQEGRIRHGDDGDLLARGDPLVKQRIASKLGAHIGLDAVPCRVKPRIHGRMRHGRYRLHRADKRQRHGRMTVHRRKAVVVLLPDVLPHGIGMIQHHAVRCAAHALLEQIRRPADARRVSSRQLKVHALGNGARELL